MERQREVNFTKRESEVLMYMCKGYQAGEIAELLKISKRTVETLKSNMFNKTNIHKEIKLVLFALDKKLFKEVEYVYN